VIKDELKGTAEALKESAKKVKEYLIDDTAKDLKKINKNLKPKKKEGDEENE